jgi:hypothetical protein
MKLREMARALALEELAPAPADGGAEIVAGHCSDLLSEVLAKAPRGGVLVTLQVHMNVVAVASHCELAAVIFSSLRRPGRDVVERAEAEGIALYISELPTFEIAGRLYEMGLRGGSRG